MTTFQRLTPAWNTHLLMTLPTSLSTWVDTLRWPRLTSSAFCPIPVYPQDRRMGMRWKDKEYVDTQLPFGLRSAPMLLNIYTNALEWILQQEGCKHLIHYLDDFLLLGPPHSPKCQQGLERMLATCHRVGVPLAAERLRGPPHGIELDSAAMEARLPQEKLQRLCSEITDWQGKKACRRQELCYIRAPANTTLINISQISLQDQS